MSAFRTLIRELVARGGRVTYDELTQAHRYDIHAFSIATGQARRLGLVTRKRYRGAPIVIAPGAVCPCCGRLLEEARNGRA